MDFAESDKSFETFSDSAQLGADELLCVLLDDRRSGDRGEVCRDGVGPFVELPGPPELGKRETRGHGQAAVAVGAENQ